jgi:hypothetical protein
MEDLTKKKESAQLRKGIRTLNQEEVQYMDGFKKKLSKDGKKDEEITKLEK